MQSSASASLLPTIDVQPFIREAQCGKAACESLVEHIIQTSMRFGFFNLVGHGIPEEVIARTIAAAYEFFQQPEEVKGLSRRGARSSLGYTPFVPKSTSLKEEFDLGPPGGPGSGTPDRNVYPETPRTFRDVVDAYYRAAEQVERLLLRIYSRALARLLDRPLSDEYLQSAQGGHRALLRLNHYPKRAAELVPGAVRNGAHADWSTLTLLAVEHEGLEVLEDGEWKQVPVVSGALTVNVGNQLAMRSNGYFKSSVHRVAGDCHDTPRVSIAFFGAEFIDPADDSLIVPLCKAGERPNFPQISIKDYIAELFRLSEYKLAP